MAVGRVVPRAVKYRSAASDDCCRPCAPQDCGHFPEAHLAEYSHEGRLRVVAWNMARKPAAWAALDRLEPDICLLNEAVVPAGRSGVWSSNGTFGRDPKRRPWTAAVISKLSCEPITDAQPAFWGSTRKVPFECSRPGSWEAASVTLPQEKAVTAVAVYGLMDELSDASVHRSLSELSPVLDDSRYKQLVVIGGDLNTGTQWSQPCQQWQARDQNVLDRFAALGLVDCLRAKRPPGRLCGCGCLAGEACEHVWTHRTARHPDSPGQTDYLFASTKMAERLASCEALATDEWFAISDHAPIVADFWLPLVE